MRFMALDQGWHTAVARVRGLLGAALAAALVPLLVLTSVAAPSSASAATISGMGTWETALRARDINGNALSSLLDPNAAFFYDVNTNLTWLADFTIGGTYFGPGTVVPFRTRNPYGLPTPGPTGSLPVRDLVLGGVGGWREPAQFTPWSGCSQPGARYINVETSAYYSCDEAAALLREFDYLVYTLLGNIPDPSPDTNVLVNTGPFRNMVTEGRGGVDPACETIICSVFPSSLRPDGFPIRGGYEFSDRVSLYLLNQGNGILIGNDDGGFMANTLVHVGDVLRTPSSVPEPSSLFLMVAGLAATVRLRARSNLN